MNLDHVEAIHLVQALSLHLRAMELGPVEVAIAPPFTDLRSVEGIIGADDLPIHLAAQHVSSHSSGAFTGEVSVAMLRRLGVRMVIVGHSERRQLFGMDDATVADTVRAVLQGGLTPIICVGETEEQREAGEMAAVLTSQLLAALEGVAADATQTIVIAYEPIWAIGTGVAATEEDAQAACALLRAVLRDARGDAAADVRILYGGSAKAENATSLVEQADVDGLLVGGASLEADGFAAIITATIACYGR
jgi:triosephosphate isomerase